MALVHVKPGAVVEGLKAPILDALLTVTRAFDQFNYTLVITSGLDGVHHGNGTDNSLHPRGYAVDLRMRDMRQADVPMLINSMQRAVGPDYDIIQEVDHIHMEYDPQHDGGKTLP